MIVKFSRYAKRRAKLYKIPETTVEKILADSNLNNGEHEILKDVSGFKYPIKIVVSVESNMISNYSVQLR